MFSSDTELDAGGSVFLLRAIMAGWSARSTLPSTMTLSTKKAGHNRWLCFMLFMFCALGVSQTDAQTYRDVLEWDDSTNSQLESFLNSTLTYPDRKVAVFDCDGTLFGQSPYYLADEAVFSYASTHYKGENDSISLAKMAVVDSLLHGDNIGVGYVKRRIDFLSGLTVEQTETIGRHTFEDKYRFKFYKEMKQLLGNLQEYDFEVWVVTASPEVLYQGFVHDNLGIPKNRILGVKSVISNGIITDQLVYPVTQDEGKVAAIETFIKADPLFVAGNSRGDLEMMNTSMGLKVIVNPDDNKIYKGALPAALNGGTLQDYWKQQGALEVICRDRADKSEVYVSEALGVRVNQEN